MTDVRHLFPELDKDLASLSHSTGIFPSQKIRELVSNGRIFSESKIEESQIQPSSIDLRLGAFAYRVRASFLPGNNSTVSEKVKDLVMTRIDLRKATVFEKGCVYIVPLLEELSLPDDVYAKANPKSTTGRLDIFTRLICDYGTEFERVPEGYRGKLYAEVVPRTFTVIVSEGIKLNQLRFVKGGAPSSDKQLKKLDDKEKLVYSSSTNELRTETYELAEPVIDNGLKFSINLRGNKDNPVIGYRAKKNAPAVDLQKVSFYDPEEFWEVIHAPKSNSIILSPDDFHILISKEKVRIPPAYAAEMVAYDPSIGEFRIHYAGFFDPGFGYGSNDIKGTCAVLEVRSHEVPFLVEDGQVVGRLIYERLLAPSDKVYGVGIGSSYQSQGLALSKHFKV
ncbi:MAG TPA: 2'-deoxycytidine 5'-triphosphate deaminase [Nitrospiraceae bacterium]|nr:2'-deoxycytidine 5'-triphosphate deaminase [Nitrospiraceae bacterium]